MPGAQGVTVGYERITGVRLPGQMADGTFSVNKSKTVVIDAAALRAVLLDDIERADLFPGHPTELRSKPTSKAIRLAIGGGIAVLHVEAHVDGQTKVTVQHTSLPAPERAEEWRFYWGEWLDALDAPATQ
ncbi:MAG: hypothetical protein KDC87_16175 [Planctomycetes bacterium]|nr:hypothetical protein [Planctomycetota bacterium]MCB9869665.1 hypothetical protein [Planctomycetota bacterium]